MYTCDLHTHTTRSDGHLSPIESIDRATKAGLRVLAITDHDITLPLSVESEEGNMINLEEYGRAKGIELLRGIEISCDSENEDVHLIGLFCNWEDSAFKKLEKQVQDSRLSSYQKLIDKIAFAGYHVSWNEFLKDAGKEECPELVHKKSIYEYLAAKGYVNSWQEGKRWVQDTPEFFVERKKPDPLEIIEMLHRTGGIVILAHPFLIREKPVYKGKRMTRYAYIDMLAEAGLDGIEACYTYDKTSYQGPYSREELEQMIRSRYENKNLFFSGGSDFHGDYKRGILNPRELGECGIFYEYYCKYIRTRKKNIL